MDTSEQLKDLAAVAMSSSVEPTSVQLKVMRELISALDNWVFATILKKQVTVVVHTMA